MSTKIESCPSCKTDLYERIVCDVCGRVIRASRYYGEHRHGPRPRRRRASFRCHVELHDRTYKRAPLVELDACRPSCSDELLARAGVSPQKRIDVRMSGTRRQVLSGMMRWTRKQQIRQSRRNDSPAPRRGRPGSVAP
jgi:hypothetical protein